MNKARVSVVFGNSRFALKNGACILKRITEKVE